MRRREGVRHRTALRGIGLPQRRDQAWPLGRGDTAFDDLPLDIGGAVLADGEASAHQAGDPVGIAELPQLVPDADGLLHQVGEPVFAHRRDDALQRLRAPCRSGRSHDGFGLRPRQQLLGGRVVQHGEPGRDIRLEREEMQDPLAKGVDRLDLQPAGCFHRAGEQAAGQFQPAPVRRVSVDRRDGMRQRRIVECHPAGQRREHLGGHVGRRRLGEGQRQDAGRVGVRQQQPDHPLGEHMGLARARMGRHPGGGARIGARILLAPGLGINHRPGHAISSPSASPSDHSCTRAKWS